MANDAPARVLVAVGERSRPRLHAILGGWCDTVYAQRLRDIPPLLHGGFDLVVIGAHFDFSRGIETLCAVLDHRPACPVACVRASPFDALGPASFDAYGMACIELGATDVLDLLEFPDDDAGNARVRALFERLMRAASCPAREPAGR